MLLAKSIALPLGKCNTYTYLCGSSAQLGVAGMGIEGLYTTGAGDAVSGAGL